MAAKLDDRICELLRLGVALDDNQIALRLQVRRQSVNQACRQLEHLGHLVRYHAPGAKIVNSIADGHTPHPSSVEPLPTAPAGLLTEDEVKRAVADHLQGQGYAVTVRWGRDRGIDIEATGARGRLLLEAKGEVYRPAQQVNYFLGAIGELVQRMSDAEATFGLALPNNRQYRGLVDRLPRLAHERVCHVVYLVRRTAAGYEVSERR